MKNKNFNEIYSSNKIVSCDGSNNNSKHPLIYLNLTPKGINTCPYCSLKYIYKEFKQKK